MSFAVFVLLAGSPLMRRKSRRALPRTLLDGSSIASPENGRLNLIRLMPHVANLYVYDNSAEADPHSGAVPAPRQLLYYRGRRIVAPTQSSKYANTMIEASHDITVAARTSAPVRSSLRSAITWPDSIARHSRNNGGGS